MRYRPLISRRLLAALAIAAISWSAPTACAQSFTRTPDAVIPQSVQMTDEPAPRFMEPAEVICEPMMAPPPTGSRLRGSRTRARPRIGGLREFFAEKRRQIEAEEAETSGAWVTSGGEGVPYQVESRGSYVPYDASGGEYIPYQAGTGGDFVPYDSGARGAYVPSPTSARGEYVPYQTSVDGGFVSQTVPPPGAAPEYYLQQPPAYQGCGGVPPECDETYHSILSFVHDWYERQGCYCPEFWRNFSQFGGAQAFKGPADLGVNGNFGYLTGVNWGTGLLERAGIGFQLGAIFAASNFEGGGGIINDRNRYQYFVTTGLFRRAPDYRGFQGGAVLDYLHDDYYVHMNLLQIRAETSYLFRCGNELGLWAAAHVLDDNHTAPPFIPQPSVTWQATNQYNGFYRRTFSNGATARCWLGLTDHADIMLGADATAKLAERWALQAAYNNLWPRSSSNIPAAIRETWGLSIYIVWYPGCKTRGACFDANRPLFKVADNSTFMVTTK